MVNGWLVTMIGPEGALDAQLPPASFAQRMLTLNRVIGKQDEALDENLVFGGKLEVSTLLRQAVSIMPGVRPEQVRRLPTGGDGFHFGIVRRGDAVTASLRMHANEVAALQRINRDGRATLQEIFFQMFAKQMIKMSTPAPETQE